MWQAFVNHPPAWHSGRLAPVLNALAFWSGLLGQSSAGLLALLAFAHAVPLWLHIPLQLACTALRAAANREFCHSALLSNEVSQGGAGFAWLHSGGEGSSGCRVWVAVTEVPQHAQRGFGRVAGQGVSGGAPNTVLLTRNVRPWHVQVAQGFMRSAHSALTWLSVLLPLPSWPLLPVDDELLCRWVGWREPLAWPAGAAQEVLLGYCFGMAPGEARDGGHGLPVCALSESSILMFGCHAQLQQSRRVMAPCWAPPLV